MTKQLEKLVVTLEAKTASYEAKLKKATDEASRWASRAKQATDSAAGSYDRFGSRMRGFDQTLGKSTNAFRLQKGAIQGVSFQLQDVAVQAQMGTNAFTILGQQGSQIASLFGPGGAMLGAVIAISAGLGGVLSKAILGVAGDFEELQEKIDAVVGKSIRIRIREINELVGDQQAAIKDLKKELSDFDALPAVRTSVRGPNRDAALAKAQEGRDKKRAEIVQQISDAEESLNMLVERRIDLTKELNSESIKAAEEKQKKEEEAAKARIQLEQAVQGQVEGIRAESFNPVEREKKQHTDRLNLFRQFLDLKLGTEAEYHELVEQENARHNQALQEAQMQHYLSQASAFENLLMQYHEAAENSAAILSETLVGAVDNFITSFSHAMASAIVQGDSLSDALKGVGQAMLTHVLGALIKMGAQMLINSLFSKQIQAIQVAAAKISGTAIAAAYAPAAAMVSLASFGSNAAPAAAGISSTVALAHTEALTGMAHDGISEVPREGTWLLDKGERVLSAQQNADFSQFMQQMSSGDYYARDEAKNINIHLSGRDIFDSNTIRELMERFGEEAGDKLNVRVITV